MPYKDPQKTKDYARAHYLANKARYIASAIKSKKAGQIRNRNYLLEYLESHPCIDCGEGDVLVLQFDHRPGVVKLGNVSNMVTRDACNIQKLKDEIDKCDIRCANCHIRRHAIAENYWKVLS